MPVTQDKRVCPAALECLKCGISHWHLSSPCRHKPVMCKGMRICSLCLQQLTKPLKAADGLLQGLLNNEQLVAPTATFSWPGNNGTRAGLCDSSFTGWSVSCPTVTS